jgi:hypothetical protein
MPGMDADELAFGDDREPWLRAWAEAHRRLTAVVAAAVVLVAGLGAGGWYLHQRSLLPAPPPDGPFPAVEGVRVVLCLEKSMDCRAGEAGQVMELVRGMPEVISPRLVSADEIAWRWAQQVTIGEGLAVIRDRAWIPQVEGRLRGPGDYESVRRRLSGQPGVMLVAPQKRDFWQGRADLRVIMCAPGGMYAACVRAGAATEAQRDAVVARLRGLDGVDEVFLQDKAFGLRLSKTYEPDRPLTMKDVPEALCVRFADPSKVKAVGQAVLRMPGVGWAELIE